MNIKVNYLAPVAEIIKLESGSLLGVVFSAGGTIDNGGGIAIMPGVDGMSKRSPLFFEMEDVLEAGWDRWDEVELGF